jgi:hypothetical protein
MCFIWIINSERARAEGNYRRRFPRFTTWLLGPQVPPPQYEQAIPSQQSQIKPAAIRPDSLLLPKYGSLRKGVGDQILEEMDDSQKKVGRDKSERD